MLVPPPKPGPAADRRGRNRPTSTIACAASQLPLKDKKRIIVGDKISVTTAVSVIHVPIGSNLELRAELEKERRLKDVFVVPVPQERLKNAKFQVPFARPHVELADPRYMALKKPFKSGDVELPAGTVVELALTVIGPESERRQITSRVTAELKKHAIVTFKHGHREYLVKPDDLELLPDRFVLKLDNIVKSYEFDFEFRDQDNVKGRRQVRIEADDDTPPDVADVEIDGVVLRPLNKARFRNEQGKGLGAYGDAVLITPDALRCRSRGRSSTITA